MLLEGESSVEYYCEARPRTSLADLRDQGGQNKHPDFLVSSPSHFFSFFLKFINL